MSEHPDRVAAIHCAQAIGCVIVFAALLALSCVIGCTLDVRAGETETLRGWHLSATIQPGGALIVPAESPIDAPGGWQCPMCDEWSAPEFVRCPVCDEPRP